MNPSRQFYTDILLYTFWSPAEINIYRSYSDPQYTYTLYIYHPPLYTSCWPYPVVYTYKNSCPYPAAIFVSSPHRVISYGTSITHLWLFWPHVRTDGNSHHHQHSDTSCHSPSLQEIRQRPRGLWLAATDCASILIGRKIMYTCTILLIASWILGRPGQWLLAPAVW